MTLFSLDYRPREIRGDSSQGEEFHGWLILGKVEVQNADERKQLIDALQTAHRLRPAQPSRCFNPRHGIRATGNGTTLEYVICFECRLFDEYTPGKPKRTQTLSSDLKAVFDKPLTDAGIPLAP